MARSPSRRNQSSLLHDERFEARGCSIRLTVMDNHYFLIASARAESSSLIELRLSSTTVGDGSSFRLFPGSRDDVVRRLADLVRSLVLDSGFSRP